MRTDDRPKTLLVADDEADIRESLAMLLAASGEWEEVALAPDAETALDLARARHREGRDFDAILTDEQMGRMSGHELLEAARAEGLAPKLFLMSGSVDAARHAAPAPSAGAKGPPIIFFPKPLDPTELGNALSGKRATRSPLSRRP